MNGPKPETISNELVQRVNALIEESDRFRSYQSFEIQRLVADANKLVKVDAALGYRALGRIASLSGRVEDAIANFDRALRLSTNAAAIDDYWTGLINLGLYARAYEHGRWLTDPKRGMFKECWEKAVRTGQVIEIAEKLPDAIRTYPELAEIDFSLATETAAVMRLNRLDDLQVVESLDLVGEILRENGTTYAENGAELDVIAPPDEQPYLLVTMPVSVERDQLRAMNQSLARRVVERLPGGVMPSGLTLLFRRVEKKSELAAA